MASQQIIFKNRYEVISKIGSGGMSEVLLACDNFKNRTKIALKFISLKKLLDMESSSKNSSNKNYYLQLVKNEFKILSSLKHPGIVSVYDLEYNYKTDEYFYTMEYLEGDTLKSILRDDSLELSSEVRFKIISDLLNIFDYLSTKKIIYDDLKPENIFICYNKSSKVLKDFEVKLIDFGLSIKGNKLIPGVRGTLDYMAPEKITNKGYDQKSDIFSFGIVLFEILSGFKFYKDQSKSAVLNVNSSEEKFTLFLADSSKKLSKISPEFRYVIIKCLEYVPKKRFSSFSKIRQILNDYNISSVSDNYLHLSSFFENPDFINRSYLKKIINSRENIVLIEAQKHSGVTRILNELKTYYQTEGENTVLIDAEFLSESELIFTIGNYLLSFTGSSINRREQNKFKNNIFSELKNQNAANIIIDFIFEMESRINEKVNFIIKNYKSDFKVVKELLSRSSILSEEFEAEKINFIISGNQLQIRESLGLKKSNKYLKIINIPAFDSFFLKKYLNKTLQKSNCDNVKKLKNDLLENFKGDFFEIEQFIKLLIRENKLYKLQDWKLDDSYLPLYQKFRKYDVKDNQYRIINSFSKKKVDILRSIAVLKTSHTIEFLFDFYHDIFNQKILFQNFKNTINDFISSDLLNDDQGLIQFKDEKLAQNLIIDLNNENRESYLRTEHKMLKSSGDDEFGKKQLLSFYQKIELTNFPEELAFVTQLINEYIDNNYLFDLNNEKIRFIDNFIDLVKENQNKLHLPDLEKLLIKRVSLLMPKKLIEEAKRKIFYYLKEFAGFMSEYGIISLKLKLANISGMKGELDFQKKYLNEVKEIIEKVDNPDLEYIYNIEKIDYLLNKGQKKEALEIALKNIKLVKTNKFIAKTPIVHSLAGRVFYLNQDFENSLVHYNIVLNYAKKNNVSFMLANVYTNMANISMNRGSNEEALKYLSRSLKIYKKLKDIYGICIVYGNLGMVNHYLNKNKTSLKMYQEEYLLSEKMNDLKSLARSSGHLAVIHTELFNFKEAQVYNFKSLEFAKKLNNKLLISYSYCNIGNVFMKTGEFKKAEKYFKKDLTMAKQLNDKYGVAIDYFNFAEINMYKKNKKKLLKYAKKSLKICKEMNYNNYLASLYFFIAFAAELDGDLDLAIIYLEKAQKSMLKYSKRSSLEYEIAILRLKLKTLQSNSEDFAISESKNIFDKLQKIKERLIAKLKIDSSRSSSLLVIDYDRYKILEYLFETYLTLLEYNKDDENLKIEVKDILGKLSDTENFPYNLNAKYARIKKIENLF